MGYTIGDEIKIAVSFEVAGTLTDPTAWQIEIKPPNAAVATMAAYTVTYPDATIVHDGAGLFTVTIDTDRDDEDHAGRWDYWVTSTGTAKASKPGFIVVDRSPF